MENLQLVNFMELQLKSKEGFAAAIDIALVYMIVYMSTQFVYMRQVFVHCVKNSFRERFKNWEM